MRFRNSIHLLMENFKNVYRVMIYKLAVALLAIALCFAFILPELIQIAESAQFGALIEDVGEFCKAFLNLDATGFKDSQREILSAEGSLHQFLRFLTSMTTQIVWACVGCLIVVLFKHFAEIFCYYAVGSIINDKMTTYAETKFMPSWIANLGKASVYALVYVPISLLFNLLSIVSAVVCISFLPFGCSLFFAMTFVAALQALKHTITGQWMPAMIADGKTLKEAMADKDGNLRKQGLKNFSTYLVYVYAIVIVNVIAGVCTFGSALLLTVPASYVLLLCVQQVNYYLAKGKKYFITYENIEYNQHYGDREHFFEYVQEQETEKATENRQEKEELA